MVKKTKNLLFSEFKNFSKENWWIYLVLFLTTSVVFFSWKWNIYEIMILFFVNLVANILIMWAIWAYSNESNKAGAVYQFLWSNLFILLAIYGFFYKWQSQYIIWQIAYALLAIKAISYYYFKFDLKYLNSVTLVLLNAFFLFIFVYYSKNILNIFWFNLKFNFWLDSMIMAIWFSFGSTWLISINDKFRYWLNYFWCIWIILGSFIWTYFSYVAWNLNWIDLGYFLLALTSFLYFSKLLPKYLKLK